MSIMDNEKVRNFGKINMREQGSRDHKGQQETEEKVRVGR